MQRNETKETNKTEAEALQRIAGEMRKPADEKDWRSTYALVMSELALKSAEKRLSREEAGVVKLESNAAGVRKNIKSHTSQLNQTIVLLNANMTQLSTAKPAAKDMYTSTYKPRFDEFQEREREITNKREALNSNIDNYIKEKDAVLAEIKQAIKSGQPVAIIKDMLSRAEKKQNELEQELENLNKREAKLQGELNVLEREVKTTLITSGIRPAQPEKPAISEKPTLGSSSST